MIYPYRVLTAVDHNLFYVFVSEQDLDMSKSQILFNNVVYQHIFSLFIWPWKVFVQKRWYFLSEFCFNFFNAARFREFNDTDSHLRYEFFPYFFKYNLRSIAHIRDTDIVSWDWLVFWKNNIDIYQSIVYIQFIWVQQFLSLWFMVFHLVLLVWSLVE